MDMARFYKAFIDTNAFIAICENRVSFYETIEEEFGKVKYFTSTSVINELQKLSKENKKIEKCLNNVLKKILNQIEIFNDTEKTGDDTIKKNYNFFDIFITNDSELVKFLLKKNKIVFRLSKNKRYVRC